jgi:isocitrate/isopropylmalate dehydrogenase
VNDYRLAVIEGDGIGRGEVKAMETVERAVESVLAKSDTLTPDLRGRASTSDVGAAVAREISVVAKA